MKLGFVVMLAEITQEKHIQPYQEIREFALRAEEVGFDSIWLYDHLLYRPEGRGTIGIWECWTMLSALAEVTRRVELGTLVVCNSFRNPAILAKMATTLDEVCGGRLILGLGAGWNQPEYEAFGLPFDHRVSRFEEALQIIRPLLKERHTNFEGKYYRAKDCEIRPRGPRPAGPPILVGCGEPRMLRLTAKYADLWNVGYMSTPDTLLPHLEHMRTACQEVGRDPSNLETTVLVALGFPDMIDKLPEFENGVLTGDSQSLAETMREYERLGVSHLMFHVVPYGREALEKLAEAVQLYRSHV